jgi:hypothetical protein
LEVTAGGCEAIFEGPALGARPALDDLGPFERAHAVGEDRPGYPWEAALELVETARAAEHLAHDQKRPTVTENLGALRYRTVLRVAARHATMLAADRQQV